MAIEAVNVKFSYKRKEVYSDLNLNIETPQAYLLLGKNGVGKTTLLKLVSGLLEPLKGKILFNSLAAFPRNPLNLVNLFFIPEEFSLPRLSLAEYSKALSIFYPNFNEADFKNIYRILILIFLLTYLQLLLDRRKKVLLHSL